MNTLDYFDFLVSQIHTVIAATTDEQGLPVTCAIDLMHYDQYGLYFLTAKGKSFYHRLTQRPFLSLTGILGKDTLSCTALSVQGKVRETGGRMLPVLLEKNPYMLEIYPTEASRMALTVFQIYEGAGEWFDLSRKPVERAAFSFGKPSANISGSAYFVTPECTGCSRCFSVCPQKCIDTTQIPVVIRQENCLHCGNCKKVCPQNAVILKGV